MNRNSLSRMAGVRTGIRLYWTTTDFAGQQKAYLKRRFVLFVGKFGRQRHHPHNILGLSEGPGEARLGPTLQSNHQCDARELFQGYLRTLAFSFHEPARTSFPGGSLAWTPYKLWILINLRDGNQTPLLPHHYG